LEQKYNPYGSKVINFLCLAAHPNKY